MKKAISLLCALVMLVSISIVPVSAVDTTGNSMNVHSVYLRTTEGKEGIYYGSSFRLNQDTISNMARYGLALTPNELADDAAWTAAMDKAVLRSIYTDGLTAGVSKEVRSTSLINIININNDSMTNNRNANTKVYVRPYVELEDGTFIYGDIGYCSMKQVAEGADGIWDTLDSDQQKYLLGMYERFSNSMSGWNMPNMKASYTSGNELILEYRREKVVANMQAQADILWSFTGESFRYSRTPSSSGYENDTQSNVYTLYPGRIYKGIPYTHGSAGLDVYYTMGTQNSDGIYVFDNLNSSFLNGGSTNGSNATTGAYNVARFGNDCWDAISWAYESIGSSVSADQTQQMTPDYGLTLLGEDILVEAMQENGFVPADGREMGDDFWAYVCDKNNSGKYVYRGISDEIAATTVTYTGTYTFWGTEYALSKDVSIDSTVDGTKLVTYATRSHTFVPKDNITIFGYDESENYNLAYDYQAMYKTYLLAQPGDAMVHWSNGAGHAIMVVEVKPVYNSDGTINGDESTIVILEQGSGHEKKQSSDSWGSYDEATHSSHSSAVSDCKYCAGYTVIDGKEIWVLNDGQHAITFKELAESDYLAVTTEELRNPTAKIAASRISDSKSGTNVTGIYSGSLSSTYRVSQITLDIFDASGNKVNTSTCFGIQSGVSSAFNLARFVTDQTAGAYGSKSVLYGTPALERLSHTYQKTDSNGELVWTYTEDENGTYYYDETSGTYLETTGEEAEGTVLYTRTATMTTSYWLEASTLAEGEYSYAMTCYLGNGRKFTFRSGYFTVASGENMKGETGNLVSAS